MMIFCLINLGVDGSGGWRALAVAALAFSVFALSCYWRSLEQNARRTRLLLVSLRGASFLLLICALAGVRLDYESSSPAPVLVSYVRTQRLSAEEEVNRPGRAAVEATLAALRGRGFEPIISTDAGLVSTAQRSEGFAAAILLTDAALGVADARREVEHATAAAGGAPVYVVTDLEQTDGPSVALWRVEVLGPPVRGVPVTLRCLVHGLGMRGHESLVTVSDTAKVESSVRVNWNNDDEWQVVTLEVVPKVEGWADYVARIEAAGGEAEALISRSLALYVEERRLRVLFFEGEPTWEAKFIRRALEQTGLFELDYFTQVSRAAASGVTTEASADRQKENEENAGEANESGAGKTDSAGVSPEARLHARLASAASLNTYDAIIVGATPNTMLSAAEAARLSSWVERRGGGLIILGGNSFAGSIAAPNGRLYTLLPTDIDPRSLASETQQVSRGAPLEAEKPRSQLALVPTEMGAGGALRGYMSAGEGTLSAALTGQGFSLRGLRAGATVLATAGQSGVSGQSDAGAPLVAAMRYGAGRVLLFAPADSWRIRTSASGAQDDTSGPFGALWQGLTMWAAEGARPQVELVLDEDSPALGQSVTAEIRVRDASFAPLKLERVKANLQPLAEEAGDAAATSDTTGPQEILFAPDKREAGVWRAHFVAPARGRFSLAADYLSGKETGSTEKRFAVVAPSQTEAGAARDTLRRTARASGGELFAAAQLNSLMERLTAASHTKERTRRTWELRTAWPLALLIPLLLSTEWFTRRWWRID
jgi:hypothetical protein